ncbi:MAG: c-type cytochrome domain-containing protein, partial [Planctomycetota bacterium]
MGFAETLDEFRYAICAVIVLFLMSVPAHADDLEQLIASSCLDCHDTNTETRLDFTKLERDFEDAAAFRVWVQIVDRVSSGEMPPQSEPRPDSKTQDAAMELLATQLVEANLRKQRHVGRVPSRRLSRLEYEHT